jgi:hypothetical protein
MIANGSGQMKGEVMAGEKETALTCASGLRLVFKGLAGFGLSLDKPFGGQGRRGTYTTGIIRKVTAVIGAGGKEKGSQFWCQEDAHDSQF